ncbi:MAG: glycerophosphodiester phosphodiesterase [Actinomycetota bacterium]
MERHPYLGNHRILALAHRGGTVRHPENTMAAFQYAVDLGYRYLETDVHASADGQLYAFHDDNLERVVGRRAFIHDLSSRDLDRLEFGDGHRIPRLEELFITWPEVHLNIDPKADASVIPLVEAIRRHEAIDRVCVGSFSDRRIAYCRNELGPELCTSLAPVDIFRIILRSRGVPTRDLPAPLAQVPMRQRLGGPLSIPVITPEFVDKAHELGIDVHVWTIDDPPTIARLVELGVDGIMTDRPDVLRSELLDHGCWEAPYDRDRA